ncbi:uncharacterized protein TNCV_4011141 [Trichonephila clavipes]|nr:uncharacterized protein TNCV_4011141 [Trichonephila clavipes]
MSIAGMFLLLKMTRVRLCLASSGYKEVEKLHRRWFALWGILYKGTHAHNPRCSISQRIYKADISTPVVVDYRAANCLEKVVRSFTTMQTRCRSSRTDFPFRRPLPVFRVVRFSSVHCFQTRMAVELFLCTRAPIER